MLIETCSMYCGLIVCCCCDSLTSQSRKLEVCILGKLFYLLLCELINHYTCCPTGHDILPYNCHVEFMMCSSYYLLKFLLAFFTKSQNCNHLVMHFTQKPSENSKTDCGKLSTCQYQQTDSRLYLFCFNFVVLLAYTSLLISSQLKVLFGVSTDPDVSICIH